MTTAARSELVERWFHLTRREMPGMAARNLWPIRFDHCFMRVCLDAALGVPWTVFVAKPAIANMTDDQLRATIAVAEAIVREPSRLLSLNAQSLEGRRRARELQPSKPPPSLALLERRR